MGKKVHKELKKITKEKKQSKVGIYTQLILTLATVILAICYFMNRGLLPYLQLSLALTMLIMGYNNQKVYKRTGFTYFYVIIGIILLFIAVMGLLGW